MVLLESYVHIGTTFDTSEYLWNLCSFFLLTLEIPHLAFIFVEPWTSPVCTPTEAIKINLCSAWAFWLPSVTVGRNWPLLITLDFHGKHGSHVLRNSYFPLLTTPSKERPTRLTTILQGSYQSIFAFSCYREGGQGAGRMYHSIYKIYINICKCIICMYILYIHTFLYYISMHGVCMVVCLGTRMIEMQCCSHRDYRYSNWMVC